MATKSKEKSESDTRIRKGDATRAAILAATARRFAEKGYADCTLREIAALTDMKAGSIYYHFPSKEKLLEEVIRTGTDRLTEAVLYDLSQLDDGADAATKLRTLIRAHVSCFLDIRGDANTFLRIYEYLPPVMRRKTRPMRVAYAQLWFDIFDEGVESGEFVQNVDRNLFIPFLLQSLNGIIEWFSPSRMTIDGACEMIDHVVLSGILDPGASPTSRGLRAAR